MNFQDQRKVFVLHENDELKIISLQNKIFQSLKEKNQKFLKKYPLWILLDSDFFEKKNCKEISLSVLSFQLTGPVVSDTEIFLKAFIDFSDSSVFEGKLVLGKVYEEVFTIPVEEYLLDLNINIFRTGFVSASGNSFCLEDSVWRKIKK